MKNKNIKTEPESQQQIATPVSFLVGIAARREQDVAAANNTMKCCNMTDIAACNEDVRRAAALGLRVAVADLMYSTSEGDALLGSG